LLPQFISPCAYVEFALSHPAHFQVMLRADAVPLDCYPKALKFEREAIRELVEVVDSAFVDLPAESKQTIVTACWALVYGLAVSILEGSLARKLGIPKARQKAEAEKAIKTIANLLGGTLNSARGPLR
jgi:hypothetical protein